MHLAEKNSINTEIELLNLIKQSITNNSKAAIVGGHFMLFYDADVDELKPLIKQELIKEKQILFADMYAGDFPAKSVKISAQLQSSFKEKSIDSKLVFIVNDHKFQSKNYQPNISDIIYGRSGELRMKYYHKNKLPNLYKSIFDEYNLSLKNDIQSCFVKNKQKEENILKDGFYFSEQRLRNKFDKNLKVKLSEAGKIKKVENSGAVEIYYNGFESEDICLTESGNCGCSGEVMEFIYELSSLGYTDIIFFIPNECINAANNGFAIVADTIKNPICIHSISGIGGMGFKDTKQIYISKYYNEQYR